MKAQKIFNYIVILIRIGLGALFLYAGIQKFQPQPPKADGVTTEEAVSSKVPEHVLKIKSFIGGLKQTGYFWPMLGFAEIVCGLLLLSQVFALLGAVMLVPLTLNIFLFEVFLGGGDVLEIVTHGLYLLANLLILVAGYPRLKLAFLTTDKQFIKSLKA